MTAGARSPVTPLAAGERVLVLPRGDVPGGCEFSGVRRSGEGVLEEMRRAIRDHGRFLERATAEVDPAYKQLIPYVVVVDDDRVFAMRRTRAGGDERLHDRVSIGVGGHLNEVDAGRDPIRAGLDREWREELAVEWQPDYELIGLLNDDSNPVGSVHLGVVFEVRAAGRRVDVREHDKLSGSFEPWGWVRERRASLESWSQMVADTYT